MEQLNHLAGKRLLKWCVWSLC